LDESLIKSPGINDKTNSDDQIEIDDGFLIESSSDLKKVTNDTLLEKMKCNLKEALKAASGKID
jgi:hypothetical protein